MPTVTLNLPQGAYDIIIEPGCLASLGSRVQAIAPHEKAGIVTDQAIEFTHGLTAARSLKDAGYSTTIAIMPQGEEHKTLRTYGELQHVMLNARLERRSPIIALGGGITGDVTGYVAATYLRGVPFVQCPTTLLAMVDASVGGKTGVNVPQGKNLIGAFHQPKLVLIDTDTLASLPPRELRAGLAECVKHGVIRDEALFAWIGNNADRLLALESEAMVELVERNVRIKAAVVEADEKESGERAHLNFGHTFGHAIESATKYTQFKHGEAISLGMVAATQCAVEGGFCDPAVLDRLTAVLNALELPTRAALPSPSVLLDAMRLDKKVQSGTIRLILPQRIGEVGIYGDVPYSAILQAWEILRPN